MKTIFDCENEIGRCDYDSTGEHAFGEEGDWTIFAQTIASMSGANRMVRIDQRCFLRREAEMLDQPWVKPAMNLEPMIGTEEEMVKALEEIHARFIKEAQVTIANGCLV